ncbi:hypothetical protein Hanom_Chr17g01560431 [Helianthus anomalus]
MNFKEHVSNDKTLKIQLQYYSFWVLIVQGKLYCQSFNYTKITHLISSKHIYILIS